MSVSLKLILRIVSSGLLFVAIIFLLDIGCVFRHITGIPCPGCGSTRAWLAFLRGDIVTAFFYHPLFLISGALLAVVLLRNGVLFRSKKCTKWATVFLIALYFSVYLVRMLLLFPHTPPMDFNQNSLGHQLYVWLLSR